MQHVPPFQTADYQPPALQSPHPASTEGSWASTIAGPDYAAGGGCVAHVEHAAALEEATRVAANTAGVLQTPHKPFFNQTAEVAFPAPAASQPAAQTLVSFPNGGGVLERGLRRHLKAQGPARPRARRVAPASPPDDAGDGPIGNLCSAAFAADSSAYALGCARASHDTHQTPLPSDCPTRYPPCPCAWHTGARRLALRCRAPALHMMFEISPYSLLQRFMEVVRLCTEGLLIRLT